MVVLHEMQIVAADTEQFRETPLVEALEKEPPLVTKNYWLDKDDIGNLHGDKAHDQNILSVSICNR